MALTQETLFSGQGGWGTDNERESLTRSSAGMDLIGFFFTYLDAASNTLTWDLSIQVQMPDNSTWVPMLFHGDPGDDPAKLFTGAGRGQTASIQEMYINFADSNDGSNRRMRDFIRLPPGKWRALVTANNATNDDSLSLVAILRNGVA